MMSFHLRILNLRSDATNKDIRKLFSDLAIEDDGVVLMGGPKGEAFVTFTNETDLLRALQKDGCQYVELQIADDKEKLEAINRMCLEKIQMISDRNIENKAIKFHLQEDVNLRDLKTCHSSENTRARKSFNSYNIQHNSNLQQGSFDHCNVQVNFNNHLKRSQDSVDCRHNLSNSDNHISLDVKRRRQEANFQPKQTDLTADATPSYSEILQLICKKTSLPHNKSVHTYVPVAQSDCSDSPFVPPAYPALSDMPSPQSSYLLSDYHGPSSVHLPCEASARHRPDHLHRSPCEGSAQQRPDHLHSLPCEASDWQRPDHLRRSPCEASARKRPDRLQHLPCEASDRLRPDRLQRLPWEASPRPRPDHSNLSFSIPSKSNTNCSGRPIPETTYSSDLAKASTISQPTNQEQKAGKIPNRGNFKGSLFKTLFQEKRAPRYNILVSDLPASVSANMVYSWVGGKNGTALGVILLKPTADEPVAFVMYDEEAERDRALLKSGTAAEAYSDYDTFQFISNFITNWFLWKKSRKLPCPVEETTFDGFVRNVSFDDMQTYAKFPINNPTRSLSKSVTTNRVKPNISKMENTIVKMTEPVPSGKSANLETTIPKLMTTSFDGSLFETLSCDGRAPRYAIFVSSLPSDVTAVMVHKWVGGRWGTSLGVILLKPTNDEPVAFAVFDNEAERDHIMLQSTHTVKQFSDADTVNFISKFIGNWFEWKSDANVNSPISESNASGWTRDISFVEMKALAKLPKNKAEEAKRDAVKKSTVPTMSTLDNKAEEPSQPLEHQPEKSKNARRKAARKSRKESSVQKEPVQPKIQAWRKGFNLVKDSRRYFIQLKTFDQTYSANQVLSWFPDALGAITVSTTNVLIGAVIAFMASPTRYKALDEASVLNKEMSRWAEQRAVTSKQAKLFLAATGATNYQIRFSTSDDDDRLIEREEAKILVDLTCKSNVEPLAREIPAEGGDSFIHCLRTPDEFWQHNHLILAIYKLDRKSTASEVLSWHPGGVCAAKLNFDVLGPHDSLAMAYIFFEDKQSQEMAKFMINTGKNLGGFEIFHRGPLELIMAQLCHRSIISESTADGVDRLIAMKEFELQVTNPPFKLTSPLQYFQLDKFPSGCSASELWSQNGERHGSIKGAILVVGTDDVSLKAYLATDNLDICRRQARKITNSKKMTNWEVRIVSKSEVFEFLNELPSGHKIQVSTETGQDRLLDSDELAYIAEQGAGHSFSRKEQYSVLVLHKLRDINTAGELLAMFTSDACYAKSAKLICDSTGVHVYGFVTYDEMAHREEALAKGCCVRCTEEGMAMHLASFQSDYVILQCTETGEDAVMSVEERHYIDPSDEK